MKPKIVIIGAGGHGKVICDAILAQNQYEMIGFVDAVISVGTVVMVDHKVIVSQAEISKLKGLTDYFIIAIGNNEVRKKIYGELKQFLKPALIIHPSAVIAANALVKQGSVCLANAVISANCVVGENAIINAGVVIDHECIVGDHIHLSIGTLIGSNSTIAADVVLPVGSIIQPFSKITG